MDRSWKLLSASLIVLMAASALHAGAKKPPKPHPLVAVVESVDATAGTVLVKEKDGTEATVATDAETVVTVDGKAATLDDLDAGMMVAVTPPTGIADKIDAKSPPPPPPLLGVVESLDATAGTVLVKLKDGTDVTVATDADTVVTVDGKAATLVDLVAGMMVVVTPSTGTADAIDAKSPPPPKPQPSPKH